METILLTKKELIEILDERLEKTFLKLNTQEKPESKEEELLTRHDVARLFGVSLVTVNAWCKKGVLKPHNMNSRVYFYKSEIKNSLESQNMTKVGGLR